MTASDWVLFVLMMIWFLGVGLLAHAVPVWLREDDSMPDYVRIGISMEPEKAAVLLAIAIASWPVSVPVLGTMAVMRKKREK